jgi:hypothetical protein
MDRDVNEEVQRVCENWRKRIEKIENSDEGFSSKQCRKFLENFISEAYERMLRENLTFEESREERDLVEDTANDLSIALAEANSRYERKRDTIFEKVGNLVPDIILGK